MNLAEGPGSTAAPPARRRVLRLALLAAAALLAALVASVAIAPALVSRGLFRGRIIDAMGGRLNGTISIDQLSLGWSGPLAARGVTIEDTATGDRLAVDLSLEQGLWTLVTRGAERLDVRVSGSLRTRREADGSLSVAKLLREELAAPGAAAAPPPAAARPGLPPGIRHVAIAIDDLDLEVLEPGGATSLAVRDLAGAASVDAGQGASVHLAARTELQGAAGSIELKATFPGLFAADGSLALAAAGAEAELRAADVAIEAGGLAMRVSKATASVRATQLTGRIDVALDVNAALDGAAPSAIAAELAIDRLLTPDGGVIADLSAVHGTVRVADLPTRPFERFAEGSGVVLARDLGPSLGLDARFADAAGGELSIALRSERLTLTARGAVDPSTRAANFPAIDVDAALTPGLLDALAQVTVTAPARLSLRARSVSIPAAAADGSVPVDALSFDADAALELTGLEVPGPEGRVPFGVTALRLSAKAAPVSAGVELSAAADRAAGDGAPPMRVTARVRRGGALGAHGSLRVEQLPTALVRPFLPRSLPIDLERDVGPVVAAVDASVTDGAAPEIAVKVDAPSVRADLRASVAADGAIAVRPGSRIEVAPVRRALLGGFGVQADADMALAVGITRLDIPAAEGAADLSRAAAELELAVRPFAQQPVGVTLGAGDAARTVRINDLRVTIATAALGSDASATVALRSDLAALDATLAAKGLGDLSQQAIDRAAFTLAMKASDVPSARLAAEIPALRDLLPHLGGASWSAELSYAGSTLQGDGAIALRSGATQLAAKAALREAELAAEATAALDATPALVAAAAPGLPVELAAPARIEASVARFAMKRTQRWSFDAPPAVTAALRIPALEVAKVPGTKGNPVLADLALEARAALGARMSAKGTLSASLAARRGGAAPAAIAPLHSSFEWTAAEGTTPSRWSADAALAPIAAEGLAALIDLDEAARREIGTGARIAAKASSADGGIAFELTSTLERLKAQVAGTLAGEELSLARSSVELALSAQQATELANSAGPKAGPDGKAPPPAWKEVGPVALLASVDSLRMRLGGGLRSAVVRVEARPFPMVAADGQRITVDGTSLALDMPSADRPASVRASTALVGAAGRAPVGLEATLSGWSRPDGSLSTDSVRIDGALKAEKASTAVLGVLLGMGAELGEAVGPELSVDATVTSTAPGAATLTARAASRYATLDAPQVELRAGALVIAPAKPLTLDFLPSPPLRRRYLATVNPVFRDIRLADDRKPIRLAVPMASYPLDGDLSRLDADLRLTVGDVVLERSRANELLDLLKQFQPNAKRVVAPVDGNIGPLAVTVRKGQLAYKDFAVGIERQGSSWKTLLIFDGDVDLTQKPPFARRIGANYPLSSVAREVVAVLPDDDGGGLIGDALSAISLNLADAAQLRVSVSGPLGDVDGKPAELKRRIKLVFDKSQVGKGLEDAGRKAAEAIGDWFRKR